MAGDWIKVEQTTPDKPEVVKMASILGIDQDAVVGKLIRLWVWADQNSVNGNDVSVTDSFLDRITFCSGFSVALRNVGWLNGKNSCLMLPNFDRHNGQTAKNRAITNRRVANHRNKRNDESVTDVTDEALQKSLPEKRREENIEIKEVEDQYTVVSRSQHAGRSASAPAVEPYPVSVDEVVAVIMPEVTRGTILLSPEAIHECAEKYFDSREVRGWLDNGRTPVPIKKWTADAKTYARAWARNANAFKPDSGNPATPGLCLNQKEPRTPQNGK